MVQAWYMDSGFVVDPRLPLHIFPPRIIPLDKLPKITGIKYYKVNDVDDASSKRKIDMICRENNYTDKDTWFFSIKVLGAEEFNQRIKHFFVETKVDWDVGRLIQDGHCYFDVKDNRRKWIRLLLEKGDFIVIPKNVPHRFTTDTKNSIKMVRYFTKDQKDEMDYQNEVEFKLLKDKMNAKVSAKPEFFQMMEVNAKTYVEDKKTKELGNPDKRVVVIKGDEKGELVIKGQEKDDGDELTDKRMKRATASSRAG